MDPQPGDWIGSEQEPDEYQLVERIKAGGEGQLWVARYRSDLAFAVKIFSPRSSTRHQHDLLQHAHYWAYARQIAGLPVPDKPFWGPAPHRARESSPGSPILYQITPLLSGAVDLRTWRRGGHGPTAAANVVAELCRIVEELHRRDHLHRDISHGNVMVWPDGTVQLIDLSDLAPCSQPGGGYTPSFGAPETDLKGFRQPPSDRFSVAAVAYFLLAGKLLPEKDGETHRRDQSAARAARRTLHQAGWSRQFTDHLIAMLADDPDQRPHQLARWGETLRRYVADDTARRCCADLASHRDDEPAVFSGGLGGLYLTDSYGGGGLFAVGPSAAEGLGTAGAVAAEGLGTARAVAADHDGRGRLVAFVADVYGRLWGAVDGVWHQPHHKRHRDGYFQVRGRPVAVRDNHGGVSCFTIEGDQVWQHRVAAAAQDITCHPLSMRLTFDDPQILGATVTPEGMTAIIVGSPAGLDCVMIQDERVWCTPVLPTPVCAAAVGPGPSADLEILAILDRDRSLVRINQWSSDTWADPEPLRSPGPLDHVAFVRHRGGVTIAIAGPGGLWLKTDGQHTHWVQLSQARFTSLSLSASRGWELRLVGMSGDKVHYFAEGSGHPSVQPWSKRILRFDG